MKRFSAPLCGFALVILGAVVFAAPAHAAGGDAGPEPGRLVAGLLLVLAVLAAAALAVLLLRIMLPGLAAVADRALGALGTARLFAQGVLPLVGAALLLRGAREALGEQAAGVLGLLVGLPLLLALLVGLLAALPHVGGRALARGAERSPLVSHLAGALVLGFPLLLWAVAPPLGLLVTLLEAGWCAGIGLGCVLGPRPAAAPPA